MDKNDFKEISMNGRIAYGICCFENTLLFLKYDVNNWKMILEWLWDFTSTENLEEWNDKITEVIPENLLEFDTYEEHDFEYLEESQFEYLYNLYQTIDDRIGLLIRQVFYLGCSHSYSVIVNYGQSSLDELDRIITFMIDNGFPTPDIEQFKMYSINENKGWGKRFDGTKLSNIL